MISIKVCGLTRLEDIDVVNQLMPDYVGFVFAPSRRQVTPELVRRMTRKLLAGIRPVGVFVNEAPRRIAYLAAQCGLEVIQLHGDEDASTQEEVKRLTGREVWKAIRVKDSLSLEQMAEGKADRFLLDAYNPHERGGSGRAFDWTLLDPLPTEKIVLAGGLTPDNVKDAIHLVKPYGVDVSSGVETDGWKDPQKIRRFIETVRGESI